MKNDVPHEEGILAHSIPRGVKVMSLNGLEDGLNAISVGVAVLLGNGSSFV